MFSILTLQSFACHVLVSPDGGPVTDWKLYKLHVRNRKLLITEFCVFAGVIHYHTITEHNGMSSAKNTGNFYKDRLIVNILRVRNKYN